MSPAGAPARISVCIATYRRLDRLDALLGDLCRQLLMPAEVIVVDNDAEASARAVVEKYRNDRPPFALFYDVQPVKNISLTRNRTVELAGGEWLAFIDDDERAPPRWLALLLAAAQRHGADGVLAPVEPQLPADAPSWIRRGGFYDWPRLPSGTPVPLNHLRFGNVLLAADRLRSQRPPFDPAYGITGGEDGDLLMRLVAAGGRLVWCDEGIVREPVEAQRMRLSWILRRALRGGQDYARHFNAGRMGRPTLARRLLFFARASLQMLAAFVLMLLTLPLGLHHAAHWLARAWANFGKLSVLWGWHYREYA